MKYLAPFDIVKAGLGIEAVNGELRVSGSYEEFVNMVRRMIAGIEVDEKWYLERYPDIADAIKQGIVQSAQQHFVNDGYFEGRQPFAIKVNERWYLTQNAGVADYVRQGKLESGQQHVEENGYKEGRLPFAL
ncbi:MAG: hypothetical protein WCI94_18395 [Rhodospirillales bacterium]